MSHCPEGCTGPEAEEFPLPFECENCGFKPTAQEVLDHNAACPRCRDSVIAYTIDTAEYILKQRARTGPIMSSREEDDP